MLKMPFFLRRFVRRNMKAYSESEAWSWKKKFSVVYFLVAWNAGGYVMYQIYQGNAHWPTTAGIGSKEADQVPPSVFYANILGVKQARVFSVQGTNFHVRNVDFEEEKSTAAIENEVSQSQDKELKE